MASMVTSIHLVKPLDFLSNNVFSKVVSMYKNRVNIARSIFFTKDKRTGIPTILYPILVYITNTLFLACDATGVFHSWEF